MYINVIELSFLLFTVYFLSYFSSECVEDLPTNNVIRFKILHYSPALNESPVGAIMLDFCIYISLCKADAMFGEPVI